MKGIASALQPYGFEWLVSVTAIAGPGSLVVVFAGPGDFYTACLTHDNKVVWVMSCGMSEVDGSTDDFNELCAASRRVFEPSADQQFLETA
jgi:hypothetical protein